MADEQNHAPAATDAAAPAAVQPAAAPTEAEKYIAREIQCRYRKSLCGQRMWSFLTHGSTIAAAVLSVFAALLAQHPAPLQVLHTIGVDFSGKNIATVLSVLVTIITTIQTKLAFERKWIANRMTQSTMCRLSVDAHMGAAAAELAQQYKNALEAHDKAITGAS